MKEKRLAILNLTAYLFMVILNTLAITLPVNQITTKEISDKFHHILTPAGFTFIIWSVIYLLLLMMVIYLLKVQGEAVNQLGGWFILSSIANGLWIIAWHYEQLVLSLMLTSIIVVSLMIIYVRLQKENKSSRKMMKKMMVSLPISVYFAWSIIAWVENLAVVLVQGRVNGLGLSQWIWGILAVFVVLGITVLVIETCKDVGFSLTIMFAFFGVWVELFQRKESYVLQGVVLLSIGIIVLLLIQAYRKKASDDTN